MSYSSEFLEAESVELPKRKFSGVYSGLPGASFRWEKEAPYPHWHCTPKGA